MGLDGRIPADEAGIVLKLGRNKLLNLIKIFHNNENFRHMVGLYPYN
jgi:hypothetical protein